jgi:hypothetical protein
MCCLVRRILLTTFLLLPTMLAAQTNGGVDYSTARFDRKVPATRASGPITLDGRLDEAAWQGAPIARDFIQNDPREGQPATYDTEVRMIYDDAALYIGVFAKDDEPDGIIISELRKDFNTGTGDSFQVVIDTFKDERNGYQFAINPAGAKWTRRWPMRGARTTATGTACGTSAPASATTAGTPRCAFHFGP